VSTTFCSVDLSSVLYLDTLKHDGPSHIGIDTLFLSKGRIPELFLRRAGVPNIFIEYSSALYNSINPIDYYTCFISYSTENQDFAERLYADLQNKGVRCWFAPHNMRIGDKIRHKIDEFILVYDKLLLILSHSSVNSQWVEHEVETAIGKELEGSPNVLFPIRLDEVVMESRTGWAAHIKLTRHIGDFTKWKEHDSYQKSFLHLLEALKADYSYRNKELDVKQQDENSRVLYNETILLNDNKYPYNIKSNIFLDRSDYIIVTAQDDPHNDLC